RQKKTLSCVKNAIFCVRLQSILPKAVSLVTCFQCVYDHRTEHSAYTDVPRVTAESFLVLQMG
ncbi:hypothetical protein, partial [Corynebacterium propinquum]|uniref:hypothetical protein n=1 Tax=Corynebacterium propinquum TaxID=43769 RepID=UPI00195521EC